jgi:hypothetical protein
MRGAFLAIILAGSLVIDSSAVAQSAGTATIKIDGHEFAIAGDYPATICGGPFRLGEGMAYQAKAGEYQITIASENRSSGNVPLNTSDGKNVNVTVTVNGKANSLVRQPSNGGKLIVSSDFKKAEATLELRSAAGRATSTLRATFVCR